MGQTFLNYFECNRFEIRKRRPLKSSNLAENTAFFSIKKNLTRKQAKRKKTNYIYSVSFLKRRQLEGVVKGLKVKHTFSKCKAAMLMFNRATIRLENGIVWVPENYTLTGSSSFNIYEIIDSYVWLLCYM